jgi:hypothetical protein
MRLDFLGDSYDIVKRLWHDILAEWAPLYADPRFIPKDLQSEYTLLTRIPILYEKPKGSFSILNDPDTGIILPDEGRRLIRRKHISIDIIAEQLESGAMCVITFDQSDYRNKGIKLKQQRNAKMVALEQKGFHALYYVSHASFLFAVPDQDSFIKIGAILKNTGIPANRLENIKELESYL